MRVKAFVDTNTFIYCFEFRQSNSAMILKRINEGSVEAYINMTVLKEIVNYFRRYYSREDANKFVKYLLESCTIIYDDSYGRELAKLKGQIRGKDLAQIAATRAIGLKYLLSFDRDFKPFPEYKTPKQFLKELNMKSRETEY